MDTVRAGQLVKVVTAGPVVDGIVFDVPSATKVVVAVVDPRRGPVFQSVRRVDLSEREAAGPQDGVLHGLIRRTPPAAHGAGRGGKGSAAGRRGFARPSMHRTTGK